MSKSRIVVIADDREKKNAWTSKILGTGFEVITSRLRTGDYTIQGLEDYVCVERKNSWREIAADIGQKRYRIPFTKMLRRMRRFPVKILVVEEDLSTLIHTTSKFGFVSVESLLKWYLDFSLQYGIQTIAIGSARHKKAILRELFKKIVHLERNGSIFPCSEKKFCNRCNEENR